MTIHALLNYMTQCYSFIYLLSSIGKKNKDAKVVLGKNNHKVLLRTKQGHMIQTFYNFTVHL